MASKLRFNKKNLVPALLYAVVGVLFCIFKSGMLNILLTVTGVLFIVAGVIQLFSQKSKLPGIAGILIGVVIILGGWLFAHIVLIIFGVLFILKGLSDIFSGPKNQKTAAILASILTIALGVLLIVYHVTALNVLFIVIGVCFILNGFFLLFCK